MNNSKNWSGQNLTSLTACYGLGRQHPGLPSKELSDLNNTMFGLFPSYWSNVVAFESNVWGRCVNSIGQLCKRLRQQEAQRQ